MFTLYMKIIGINQNPCPAHCDHLKTPSEPPLLQAEKQKRKERLNNNKDEAQQKKAECKSLVAGFKTFPFFIRTDSIDSGLGAIWHVIVPHLAPALCEVRLD